MNHSAILSWSEHFWSFPPNVIDYLMICKHFYIFSSEIIKCHMNTKETPGKAFSPRIEIFSTELAFGRTVSDDFLGLIKGLRLEKWSTIIDKKKQIKSTQHSIKYRIVFGFGKPFFNSIKYTIIPPFQPKTMTTESHSCPRPVWLVLRFHWYYWKWLC